MSYDEQRDFGTALLNQQRTRIQQCSSHVLVVLISSSRIFTKHVKHVVGAYIRFRFDRECETIMNRKLVLDENHLHL